MTVINIDPASVLELAGLPAGVTRTLQNVGSSTVYFDSQPQVSSSKNSGSVAPGGIITIGISPCYIASPGGDGQVDEELSQKGDTPWQAAVAQPVPPLPSVLFVAGHSFAAGAMSNPTTNRQSAKLAKACKGTENNKGVGSSILCTQTGLAGLDTSSGTAGIVGLLQAVTAARTPGTDQFITPIEGAFLVWGINDWAIMGGTQFALSFPPNLHTAIRRLRAGAVFEDADASVTYPTGSWALGSGVIANSGAGNHSSTAALATVAIAVPSQYQGQAIDVGIIDVRNAYTVVATDEKGNNLGTLTAGNVGFSSGAVNRNGYQTLRIPQGVLSAGSHTITLTYTQSGANPMFFDYWQIESSVTPPILIELANRIPDYTKHGAGWPFAPLSDAAIASMNSIMQTVAESYSDGHVACVAMDDITANNVANLTLDQVHPNSIPAGAFAHRCYNTLLTMQRGRNDILALGTA